MTTASSKSRRSKRLPSAACARPLDHPTRGPVCASCWISILPLTPPLCDACGDPLPTWRTVSGASARCPRCRRGRPHLDRCRAVGAYDGALPILRGELELAGFELERTLDHRDEALTVAIEEELRVHDELGVVLHAGEVHARMIRDIGALVTVVVPVGRGAPVAGASPAPRGARRVRSC